MNFILALLIFLILGIIQGVPAEQALIGEVQPDSPAAEAGILDGDEVIQIEGTSVSTWEEFTSIVQEKHKQEISLVVQRGDVEQPIIVTPREAVDPLGETVGQVGVQLGFEKSFLKTFQYGFVQTYDTTKMILTNLLMLVTGQYSIDMLSGPVG